MSGVATCIPQGTNMISVSRYRFRTALLALLMTIGVGTNSAGGADGRSDPLQLVRSIGNAIVSVLTGQSTDYEARKQKFRDTYRANFDGTGILFAVAGPVYRQASPEQRQQLSAALEDYIVTVYATRLTRYYTGEKLIVLRSEVDGDVTIVASLLVPRNSRAQGIEITWRLVNVGGSLRIRDVVIDKISVVLSLRREVASLLRGRNGDVDALIAALRRNTREAEAAQTALHLPDRAIHIRR